MTLQQHPLSAAFPAMTDTEFAELRADIAANGLRMPITLYEDQVLDGWHRYCACSQIGTDPRYEKFKGGWHDAVKFVVGANVMRRHLSSGERADAAAVIANIPPTQSRIGLPVRRSELVSQAQAAELFGVSVAAVQNAKTVADSGDEELKAKVKSGEIPSHKAAAEIRKKRKAAKAEERKAQPAPLPRTQTCGRLYRQSIRPARFSYGSTSTRRFTCAAENGLPFAVT